MVLTLSYSESKESPQQDLSKEVQALVFTKLKNLAEAEALWLLKSYLLNLLKLQAISNKVTMGVKPGFHQGVRLALINENGKFIKYSVIYPFKPVLAREEALIELTKLIIKYKVEVVAIGSGAASIATKQLFKVVKERYPDLAYKVKIIDSVGAESYVDKDLGDLDPVFHPCLSIARRLQNPKDAFAKIEPRALGQRFLADLNEKSLIEQVNTVMQRKKAKVTTTNPLPKNTAMFDALQKWKLNK